MGLGKTLECLALISHAKHGHARQHDTAAGPFWRPGRPGCSPASWTTATRSGPPWTPRTSAPCSP